MKNEFQELKSLFEAYLHQDFELVSGSAKGALLAYKEEASKDEIEKMKAELQEILLLNLDEDSMKDLLITQLECAYYYPSEWQTGKEWLSHLQSILK